MKMVNEKNKKIVSPNLEGRLKEQVSIIEQVREATGLSIEQMARMIALKPQTLTKYAAGYQPASHQVLQLIQGIPARVGKQVEPLRDLHHATALTDPDANPTLQRKFNVVLERCTFGEIAGVRALIDEFYRLALKRDKDTSKTDLSTNPPSSKIINIRPDQQLAPVYGDIAAGLPQEAIEQAEMFVVISAEIAKKCTYVLRARGLSMVDREINDGDLVAFDHRREPRDNDVVAALIDGEMTLKTYVAERGGKVFLKSENSRQPMSLIPVNKLTIQGVMVANLGPA